MARFLIFYSEADRRSYIKGKVEYLLGQLLKWQKDGLIKRNERHLDKIAEIAYFYHMRDPAVELGKAKQMNLAKAQVKKIR
jgi:hypothetical protein